jgi:hypothetical protein
MERNPQQASFERVIHLHIQHLAGLEYAVLNPPDPAIAFLQNKEVVKSNKRHRGRLG